VVIDILLFKIFFDRFFGMKNKSIKNLRNEFFIYSARNII
jgi:hypothetical protein